MHADLVVFGEDWNGHPSSTQHLIGEISRSRKVLWVNSIGMRRPRLNLRDTRRALNKLWAASRGPNKRVANNGNVTIVNPRVFPWPSSKVVRMLNQSLLASTLRKRMRNNKIDRPVLWLTLPTAVDMIGELGERAVVYYCGDDFGALEGVDHEPILEMEAALAQRADLIFVSHPALLAKFPHNKVHYVPHGVDAATFNAAAAHPCTTNKPVAGFVGSIDSRLDFQGLATAAASLPNWEFHLWGPIKADVSTLRQIPNIMFKGVLAPERVPGTLKSWRVSLLPYVDNAMVRACNPLKLREYLAAGTPVVASNIPAAQEFSDVITITKTATIATAIAQTAAHDSVTSRARRLDRVAGQTWEAQAARVSALIDSL